MNSLSTFSKKWLDKLKGKSSWIDYGTLTGKVTSFGGTNPTFSGMTTDKYYYKETHEGDLHVRGELDKAVGGSAGTSSYQLSLPAGYQFDTNFVNFEDNNGDAGTGRAKLKIRSGIGSCCFCFRTLSGSESMGVGVVVPTSPTTFRLAAIYNRGITVDAEGFWGASWFAAQEEITITFDATLPVIKV